MIYDYNQIRADNQRWEIYLVLGHFVSLWLIWCNSNHTRSENYFHFLSFFLVRKWDGKDSTRFYQEAINFIHSKTPNNRVINYVTITIRRGVEAGKWIKRLIGWSENRPLVIEFVYCIRWVEQVTSRANSIQSIRNNGGNFLG